MQYRLIIFLMLFGVSTLGASTFTDVSLTANVHQREVPVDAASGAWLGPRDRRCRLRWRWFLARYFCCRRWWITQRALSQ